MTLGRYIREARERKRITLRALGKLVGVSAPFLSDVEHDRRCPETLDALAVALDVPLVELTALDPRQIKRSDLDDLKRRVARLEAAVSRMGWRS